MEVGNGLDYVVLLGIREFGVDREREDFPAGFFGFRKFAGLVAKIGERFLQMNAQRVVNLRRNASSLQEGFQVVAARRPDGELIVDVLEFRGWLWRGGNE